MIRAWQYVLAWPLWLRASVFMMVLLSWSGLCLWPVHEASGISLINDKLAHGIGNFGLLGALIIWRQRLPLVAAWLSVVSYSVGIEILQIAIPGRYFDYYDMLANAVGALLALCIISYLRRRSGLGVDEAHNGLV